MALRVSEEEAVRRGWVKQEPLPPPPEPVLKLPPPPTPPSPTVVYLPGRVVRERGAQLSPAFVYTMFLFLGWLVGFVMGLMF